MDSLLRFILALIAGVVACFALASLLLINTNWFGAIVMIAFLIGAIAVMVVCVRSAVKKL